MTWWPSLSNFFSAVLSMFPFTRHPLAVLVIVLLSRLLRSAVAFDVSWIPSDPDGPLPQSTRYRETLERLCVLIKDNARLPPELQAKREVLTKMCRRLEDDKRLLNSFGMPISRNAIGLALAIGGGAAVWICRDEVAHLLRSFLRAVLRLGKKPQDLNDARALEALRQARLKRYQEAPVS